MKTTVCKTCDEPRMQGRRFCITCILKQEKEKKIKYREKARAKKKREAKKESKSTLTKELDKLFSIYIRHRDKYKCISCGAKGDLKSMQCGHYIRRSVMNTRWDEENCSCQCQKCNIWMSGNYPAYTLALMSKYGAEIIEELNERSQQVRKWEKSELKEMIKKYSTN
uniref:Putative lambda recombination protein n=1 Tax=viral metagenome TaxID=1070528 RepID=A0A6H1ZKM9_9ZZZZ